MHNDNGTVMNGSDKTVLSIHLGKGTFAIDSKVQALYSATSPFVTCTLVGPSGTLDTSYWYVPGGGGYGELVNQAVVTTNSPTNVQLNCNGSNATVNFKKLQSTRVAVGTDALAPNVAKSPLTAAPALTARPDGPAHPGGAVARVRRACPSPAYRRAPPVAA